MNRMSRLTALFFLLLAAKSIAAPADAQRIQKAWDLSMETWSLETRVATTPEARSKALAARPDAAAAAREMWKVIAASLDQEWTLEPAAWFLRATPGLITKNPDGSTTPTFAKEIDAVRKAVETRHIKSPKLTPMCMALAATQAPRSLALLEKIQASHPDKKIQGVAALAAAMIMKTLGDDAELMKKRLNYLTKAIIQSWDVDLGGTTVAKLAEDELYIIRFLTKGRVAPDLIGTDSGGLPVKLSDFKDKVVMLLFWNSTMPEAERVIQLTSDMVRKFHGKPFVVLGVNYDPVEKLRFMEGAKDTTVNWRNLSDPEQKLSREYRVGSWPLVYVLDGERKIHYAGTQGSFAELTADALLTDAKPAAGE